MAAATETTAKRAKKKALFDDEEEGDDEGNGLAGGEQTRKNDNNDTRKAPGGALKVNRKYARDFEARKQREELRRSTALALSLDNDEGDDDIDEGSSSSSSSEDEDGEMWTTQTDVDILRTINAIRSKDERIYDPHQRFFPSANDDDEEEEDESGSSEDEADATKGSSRKRAKPKRYKDVVREQVLEQMEEEGDGDEDSSSSDDASVEHEAAKATADSKCRGQTSRLAYNQQQQELRQAILDSTQNADDSDEDEDKGDGKKPDGWLALKSKKRHHDESSAGAMAEYQEEIQKLEASLTKEPLAEGGTAGRLVDPRGEVRDGEKFLLEYFRNRTWIEKGGDDDDDDEDDDDEEDDDDNDVEGDDEAAKASFSSRAATSKSEGRNLSEDEGEDGSGEVGGGEDDSSLNELERADDFEAQYNFRFEQAATGAAASGADRSLVRYGRGQDVQTLRRKDESRKEKRLKRHERKAAERQAKEEQLRRLKNAKRQEIQRKLRQVKSVLGAVQRDNGPDGDDEDDLGGGDGLVDEATILKLIEGDFDPDKFEELMQSAYGEDFYSQQDQAWKSDKDVRDSLRHDEDGDLIVGQDSEDGGLYDNVAEDEEDEDGANADDEAHRDESGWNDEDEDDHEFQEEQGETNIEKKVKSKLMEELYKLDYEDIVAGQPTRFKYRQVQPNSFGLSTEEILFARDSTLKQFVSLKKIAPYREDEPFVGSRKRRRFRDLLKHDMEEVLATNAETPSAQPSGEKEEGDEMEPQTEKKKKKNRRLKKSKKKDVESNKKDHAIDRQTWPVKDKVDQSAAEATDSKSASPSKERDESSKAESDDKRDKKKNKKRKRKSKKHELEGIPEGRLASYGL